MKAPLPVNERERLRVLQSYQILDSAPEKIFDQITRLAQKISGTPIALISLIDANRQWFKSKIGVDICETPRDQAFCAHAILYPDIFIIPNTLEDRRFANHPMVVNEPHLRFYAGVPLVTPEGHALGTLCVVDYSPRELSPEQVESLKNLGKQAMLELQRHRDQCSGMSSVTERRCQQKNHRRFLWQVAGGFGLASLIFIGIGLAFNWGSRQVIETEQRVSQTFKVIANLEDIHADLRNARSSVQSYVITNQQEYLQAYQESWRATAQKLITLRSLTRDSPEQQQRIRELTQWIQAKQNFLQQIIHLRQRQGYQAAAERLAQQAPQHSDPTDTLLGQMKTIENTLLQQRSARVRQSIQIANLIGILGLALILSIVAAIYWIIYREILRGRQAEDQLEQQRDFTDTIFDSARALIVVTNRQGEILRFNRACEQITGYSIKDVIGTDLSDLLANLPEAETVKQLYQNLQATDFPCQQENHLKTLLGETRLIVWSSTALLDGQGQVEYVIHTGIDITDQRQAELALRDQQEWLAITLSSIGDAVIATDRQAIITLMNPVAEAMTGWTVSEAIGRSVHEVFKLAHHKNHQPLVSPIQQTMQEPLILGLSEDTVLVHRQGRYIPIDDSCAPIRSPTGDVEGAVIVFRDISARKQMEEDRDRFFSLSLDLFCIAALDGQLERVNSAWEVTLGWTKAELLTRPPQDFLQDLVHPEDQQATSLALKQLIQEEQVLAFENRLRCKDGSYRWVLWNAIQFNDRIYAAAHDITNRKQREAAIQTALQKEKDLNNLKSKFISMVSHEFRTPLTTILSSTELLETSSQFVEDRKQRHFKQIKTSIQRMTSLLDDVLILSRTEAHALKYDPYPLNLNQFCRDLVEEMEQGTGRHHILYFTEQGDGSDACMDSKLLNPILTNLLSNAFKYSSEGSEVRFDLICQTDWATIKIQDQGIGIPWEELPMLYQRFHRAHNVGNISGTGLGLSIVKSCLDLHQGSIEVSSTLGVGTTFTVTLPLHRGAPG
ncbi:hypothetical protein BST81_12515 [Leptolyngbya sp. 'hensonii']|uniref:PAS domain S-box protein n=1 Tax=Leptolyngbya sp. 'hensonii' TaxID=1922337 RepID=UPI00094FE868|nr:PAS domain S-box protein [Leptolyngbya sp. 'hensonii']OLP17876.1 hypothetical protein BST81_12515 [Leptolyngbya sp. 'hensonii']